MATASYLTDKIKLNGAAYNLPRITATGVAGTQPPYVVGNIQQGYGAYTSVNDGTLYPTLSPSADDNPLWIIYNGSLVHEWATISAQHDGQQHLICTLENGNYIKASNSNGGKEFTIYYYNDQDQLLWSGLRPTRSYTKFCALTVTKNDDNGTLYMQFLICAYNPDNVYDSSFYWSILPAMNASANSTFANDAIVPAYTWRSWPSLAGNSGQFATNLPIIKEATVSEIEPFDYKVLTSDDFASSLSGSIWNTYLNALLGIEYTIAYSGNNRATLTVANHATDPGIKVFTFKFYLGATEAPFATIQEDVIVGGENPALIRWDYYISFLYDATEHVAAFYPIEYTPNNSLIKYSHQIFTALSETTMGNMYTWLTGSSDSPSGSGPYDTGTTDNGGTPSGQGHQDPMPTVHVPTLSGAAAGLFTIYCPTDAQLADIGDFLWSDDVLDNFKKYFNNFSDNIIALYVLPYKPANLPTKAFTVGTVVSDTITSVEYLTSRFVSIPMGEITVGTRWDSYLDFEPYTKFSVYLPGIGVQALSADDIICPANMDESMPIARGSKLSLEYVLDLMTGNVAAYIKINGQIRYQFTGKTGYSIPITGANYNSMVQGYVMATAGLIGTLATGGTAAPFAASAGAAGIINAMKPDVYRGGNLSGDSSALCLDYPYLIRRRPNKPYLKEQEIYTGFPSYKSGTLSEFSGYTQVLEAHVEGISCTETERAEILQLLKSGVII